MARRRALLTDSERDILANPEDYDSNRRYQVISRIRRKISEELTEDVTLLSEHHPELLSELRDVVSENDG